MWESTNCILILSYVLLHLLALSNTFEVPKVVKSYSLEDPLFSTRYVARVMYDGTNFRGWQEQQPKLRTIQGVISKKLSERYGNKRVRVTGAGRTDQGVHARGQAIHFDVPAVISDVAHFEHSFNRMLPGDVRIFNLTAAPPGNQMQRSVGEPFHAIKSAVGKLYVYRFTTNAFMDPMLRNYCTHVYLPVNLDLFRECLSIFQGTHDFRAFGNRVEQSEKDFEDKLYVDYNTVRTINSVHFVDEGRGYYRIEFDIQSAIYKMIRNIVGTSLHVAAGNMPIDALQTLLLTSPPRNDNIAMPAPPQGLTLEHVYYDHF